MRNDPVVEYGMVVDLPTDPIERATEYERVADIKEAHGYWGSASQFRGAAAKLRLRAYCHDAR